MEQHSEAQLCLIHSDHGALSSRSGQCALNNSLQLMHHLSACSLNGDDSVCPSVHSGGKKVRVSSAIWLLIIDMLEHSTACSQSGIVLCGWYPRDNIHKAQELEVNQICDRGRLKSNNSKITFPISKSFSVLFFSFVTLSPTGTAFMLLMLSTFSTDLASSTQKRRSSSQASLKWSYCNNSRAQTLHFFTTFPPSRQSKRSCTNECEHRSHSIWLFIN